MFCSECGYEIKEKSIWFCPECGTQVEKEETLTKNFPSDKASGVIFTNIHLLAELLSITEQHLTKLLCAFIEEKNATGLSYKIVDAGNYTYQKKRFLGKVKTVHLNPNDSLWDYMDILMDVCDKEPNQIRYLFIIGGDNIIPMPCIRHFIIGDEDSDQDIDTDILYAYPYGQEIAEAIHNQILFTYDPLYHVGRLPLAEDAQFNDLKNYLERDIQYSDGIPVNVAYGQCDPNWKLISGAVSSDLTQRKLLPNLSQQLTSDIYHRGLILSPMITDENVDRVFNETASIYYFNLHGSNGKEARGYFGQTIDKKWCVPVIEPENMASCKAPNIVFSEACYGGRFIGFDKRHSIMMSSLFGKTLSFVGASRVAWGAIDKAQSDANEVEIAYADILANIFVHCVLEGHTVAEALYLARAVLLNSGQLGDPYAAASAVEFNLYGDPSIKMNLQNKVNKSIDAASTLVKKGSIIGCSVKNVTDKSKSSILEMAREAVDINIKQIHSTINDYLYSNYKIQPRELNNVFKINYANKKEEMLFEYKMDINQTLPGKLIVSTSSNGCIKKVYTSK